MPFDPNNPFWMYFMQWPAQVPVDPALLVQWLWTQVMLHWIYAAQWQAALSHAAMQATPHITKLAM